jgi:preprotein translocase subunit SecA
MIPPHKPTIRQDKIDKIYRTSEERYEAVLADIKDCQKRGQPVLVGTTSIESSELLSKRLSNAKLQHQVLNAKQHEKEAHIIAQAGQKGMITIATNMAGRGTDIVLGGNIEVDLEKVGANKSDKAAKQKQLEAIKQTWQKNHEYVVSVGGLHIIGTERHESRRIDNQLRGRSGRQGDPGSSAFYLSLEDPLLRIFGSDRVASIMEKLDMPQGEPIEHPWVNRSIEGAQKKVEARNFDIRKQLLEFDDVPNQQRRVIYEQRNDILESEDLTETVERIVNDVIEATIYEYIPPESVEEMWDIPALEKRIQSD